jgi:tRNA(Arg) A34 adenosine deaminase TadA
MNPLALPPWLPKDFPWEASRTSEECMALSISIALASARHGGGPFGAVLADEQGQLVEIGWNNVIESRDSTAHAEIHCLRRAQQRLGTHNLRAAGELTLYSSCAPCIQCFGAIFWSGVTRVYTAATKEDAEKLGFQEGPATEALWEEARREKGIVYTPCFCRDERALEPFRVYLARGGVIYSRE